MKLNKILLCRIALGFILSFSSAANATWTYAQIGLKDFYILALSFIDKKAIKSVITIQLTDSRLLKDKNVDEFLKIFKGRVCNLDDDPAGFLQQVISGENCRLVVELQGSVTNDLDSGEYDCLCENQKFYSGESQPVELENIFQNTVRCSYQKDIPTGMIETIQHLLCVDVAQMSLSENSNKVDTDSSECLKYRSEIVAVNDQWRKVSANEMTDTSLFFNVQSCIGLIAESDFLPSVISTTLNKDVFADVTSDYAGTLFKYLCKLTKKKINNILTGSEGGCILLSQSAYVNKEIGKVVINLSAEKGGEIKLRALLAKV